MNLEDIIRLGIEQKATDIHLEGKAPITFRVNGALRRVGGQVEPGILRSFAKRLLNNGQSETLRSRGSVDFCRRVAGVQCRINVLLSGRGMGFAIRLLPAIVNSLELCNLHPCLRDFIGRDAGLIILTGPTGSGKSTTMAALVDEINEREARHIITLESPIEYRHSIKKSLIRQREVGVHTPTYEQGLLDALREDPDVLVVGEMREAETMRLALNAAETGHLVLATMHSASAVDAVYRMMMSFPPERQSTVLAQIADSLVAVISQKLTYRPDVRLLVPCCEILVGTYSTRNVIRKGDISKLPSILQTGGPEGMYTFERYQGWLDSKSNWQEPPPPSVAMESGLDAESDDGDEAGVSISTPRKRVRASVETDESSNTDVDFSEEPDEYVAGPSRSEPDFSADLDEGEPEAMRASEKKTIAKRRTTAKMRIHKDGRFEIPAMDQDLDEIVKEFKKRSD